MEIIQTLKSNTSPDVAQQLFKTLSETSTAVSKANEQAREQNQDENSSEAGDDKKAGIVTAGIGIDEQLKLLLDNLSANGLVNKKGERKDRGLDSISETGVSSLKDGSNYSSKINSSSLITHAYHLINEVIMYPQIMWTRNFFYSLGAMHPEQQQIMHDWFSEMNEVSDSIYFFIDFIKFI